MKGIVPLEELLLWYRTWNRKIDPQHLRVLGGEPLLHPHLETILYETRNHWQNSRIELITNGLLLPKTKASVFTALKKIGASVAVSRHFDDPHYNQMFEAGIKTLREHGIEPRINQSNWFWLKCYCVDKCGRTCPYQSDPDKAWNSCSVKNICTTLLDNCLYRCPQLACYSYAVKQGFVSDAWNVVLGYKPLLPDCTREELEAFKNGEMCKQCSVCPEKFEYADMYEKINLFGLPLTKNLFCGDPNDDET